MAGSRHHVLPRFLLKGFASRADGDKSFAYVYDKEREPFECSTRDISVSRFFYGSSKGANADDLITDTEPRYVDLVQRMRLLENGAQIDDPILPEFVAHLAIRTKHLRDSFWESTEFLHTKAFEVFEDPVLGIDLLLRYVEKRPERIKQQIEQSILSLPLPLEMKGPLLKKAQDVFCSNLRQSGPVVRELLAGLRPEIFERLKRGLKESHIKAVLESVAPKFRVECYQRLHWYIVKSTELPVIIGDSGCLFEFEDGPRFKFIDEKGDKIKNAFLPISKDCIVVGTAPPEFPRINFDELNHATARCSRDYFVASELSTYLTELQPLLGLDSEILTKEQLQKIVEEVIAEDSL